MKRYLLAVKIAAVFALLVAAALAATLVLFLDVVGHDLIRDLHFLHAYEGIVIVEQIEEMLSDHDLGNAAITDWIAAEAQRRSLQLKLHIGSEVVPEADEFSLRFGRRLAPRDLEIKGRRCRMLGPPLLETWLPIFYDGREVAQLEVHGKFHTYKTHRALLRGFRWIGAVTLAAVAGLAIYLTAPLRRMSRSMDRIADGDLEHRVPVRGKDEVAILATSFNAMADRIRDMITGQKELMAGVSHELRSPLARMKVSLELLRKAAGGDLADNSRPSLADRPRPGLADRVADLDADADAIDEMIEELLLASRIELGANPLAPEILELDEVVDEAWSRIADEAAGRGMAPVLDLGSAAKHVAADRALTVRAFGNLFENAVRYAGEGEVQVSARRAGDRVEIAIADRGPGVGEGHLEHLFEPFYRVDSSRSRKTGAGGLGLMIVRRAIEAHGGRVRAEPRPNGGLVVAFDLPAAPTCSSST